MYCRHVLISVVQGGSVNKVWKPKVTVYQVGVAETMSTPFQTMEKERRAVFAGRPGALIVPTAVVSHRQP